MNKEEIEKNFSEYLTGNEKEENLEKLSCLIGTFIDIKKEIFEFYDRFSREILDKEENPFLMIMMGMLFDKLWEQTQTFLNCQIDGYKEIRNKYIN